MDTSVPSGEEPATPGSPAAFCGRCGKAYVGPYCTRCGRARADDVIDRSALPAAPPVVEVHPTSSSTPFESPPRPPLRRRELGLELAAVAALFWVPATLSAVVGFLASRAGGATTRFTTLVHGHPLENMVLLCLAYVGLAGAVPVTLLLLRRSGDAPGRIGLSPLSWRRDAIPAVGLAAAIFAVTAGAVMVINLIPGFAHLPSYVPNIPKLPAYDVVWAFVVSATTALAEESVMGAYLVTRLEQLGLSRLAIFVVAAVGRTAYHSYYGADMVYTLPSTIMFTASFIRQRRLGRVVGAHFLYDFTLMTIAILR